MSAFDLGSGWPCLLVPDAGTRALSYVSGPHKVAQSIWLILDTEPGERVMRPSFGCGLRRFLMQPNTLATRAVIRQEVETALATWEPRIALTQVDAEPGADPALIEITIRYLLLADRRSQTLVYPLSLE